MDPFDSLLLATLLSMEQGATLISRDKKLLETALKHVPACTPEDYLKKQRH